MRRGRLALLLGLGLLLGGAVQTATVRLAWDAPAEVSDWEASFIEDMLKHRPRTLSEKQQEVIKRMAEKYLGEVLE